MSTCTWVDSGTHVQLQVFDTLVNHTWRDGASEFRRWYRMIMVRIRQPSYTAHIRQSTHTCKCNGHSNMNIEIGRKTCKNR